GHHRAWPAVTAADLCGLILAGFDGRIYTMARSSDLSNSQARRIALAAQGFTDRPPVGIPDRRALRRVLGRTQLLQIDSVNVLTRAHYLPAFSRLGPYPTE